MKKTLAILSIAMVSITAIAVGLSLKKTTSIERMDTPNSLLGSAGNDRTGLLAPAAEDAHTYTTEDANETVDLQQAAEQILAEIADANIAANTDDLQTAFARLGQLCETAIQTRDAMLTVRYDRVIDTEELKGTEDGNQ